MISPLGEWSNVDELCWADAKSYRETTNINVKILAVYNAF